VAAVDLPGTLAPPTVPLEPTAESRVTSGLSTSGGMMMIENDPYEWLSRADRYRRLATVMTDAQAAKALVEMASEYDVRAGQSAYSVRPERSRGRNEALTLVTGPDAASASSSSNAFASCKSLVSKPSVNQP
jgi:hypothetical protein